MAIVLTIAGFDPSGGAGVQADQRVIEAMGAQSVSVVTALTSQSTHSVSGVYAPPADVLRSQLDALLADVSPDAVKIGLLPSAEHVEVVADTIGRFNLPNVVLDPVLAPTTGLPFLDENGIQTLLSRLLPFVVLITPNVPEAIRLTGCEIASSLDMEATGRILWQIGAKNSLVKGGHLSSSGDGAAHDDLFIDRSPSFSWIPTRLVDTPHRHGTGCYLSSAIAVGLAQGKALEPAIRRAKRLLENSLSRPRIVGGGRGSPGAPDVAMLDATDCAMSDRIARLRGIYFVTDDSLGSATRIRESVLAALLGGVRVIQLRGKSLPTEELTALALQVREDTRAHGALLVINDAPSIAQAVDADGVHLGPDDIGPVQARRIIGPGKLIGISANSAAELDAYGAHGVRAASYVGCGPVYATSTKSDAGAAIGVDGLARMRELTDLPIIAIGGIDARNIGAVRDTGVSGAAVVSAISRSADPEEASHRLIEIWDRRDKTISP